MAAPEVVPFDLLLPDAQPLVPPANTRVTEKVTLCFTENDRLVGTERDLNAPVALADVVNSLADPPDANPTYRTSLGSPSIFEAAILQAGVVRVDLTPAVSTLGGNNQLLAVAQIVCTLTARPGVGQVTFSLGGSPVDVPRGDGSLTQGPVSRDDFRELFS